MAAGHAVLVSLALVLAVAPVPQLVLGHSSAAASGDVDAVPRGVNVTSTTQLGDGPIVKMPTDDGGDGANYNQAPRIDDVVGEQRELGGESLHAAVEAGVRPQKLSQATPSPPPPSGSGSLAVPVLASVVLALAAYAVA